MRQYVCEIEAIPDRGSFPFTFRRGEADVSAFLLRLSSRVYAYRNSCRHWPEVPLCIESGVKWAGDGTRIVCLEHGAEYAIPGGECIRGPCHGAHLIPIPCVVEDGRIYVSFGGHPTGSGDPSSP